MSNPSVTATISADDKASPKLRELVELTQRLSQAAKAAFNESAGTGYANSFRQANTAAMQHLSVLERIHKAHAAIGATVAGYLGGKALHAATDAVGKYLPLERGVRYQGAVGGYSVSDMALLERQRIEAAVKYGMKNEDALHGQMAFTTRGYNAGVTAAATDQAIRLSKALDTKVEDAANIIEGLTFGRGARLQDAEQAARETRYSADLAAVAAKKGAMKPEDVAQFGKYALGMGTAAGMSPEQMFAIGMTLKKQGIGGDEGGVFTRQLAARLMSPTRAGMDALAHMGINYADYAPQGPVSADAIDATMRRRFGKGLSADSRTSLQTAIDGGDALASRESFATAVREAVEASGESLSKTDQKHLTTAGLAQYDLAKGKLRGSELIESILQRASARDLQAFLGDKQGGRGAVLLDHLEDYAKAKGELQGGQGLTDKIAGERMQGLAAAMDRLTASVESASNSMVKANQGWLTPLAEAGAKLAGFAAGLSDAQKQALSVSAGLASLSGLAAAGATIASVISSLTGLAASANIASAALTRVAGGSALGTAASAAGGVAAGAAGSRVATGLGVASKGFGWLSIAALFGPTLLDELGKEAAGTDDAKGGGAANYRKQLARLHAPEFEDLLADNSGPLDRYQPANPWKRRRGATSDYLRQLGASDDGADSGVGWQDSIRSVAPSTGFKDVAVTGTVTGSAELHNMIQVDVKPTTYFEGVVQRAESVANMNLNGKLGTSMQGPGDNGTKPAQPSLGSQ